MPPSGTCQPNHSGNNRRYDRSATHVRLQQQKDGKKPGKNKRLEGIEKPRLDQSGLARQVTCQVNDDHQLDRFDHLEIDQTKANPARAAIHRMANARHQDHQQSKGR